MASGSLALAVTLALALGGALGGAGCGDDDGGADAGPDGSTAGIGGTGGSPGGTGGTGGLPRDDGGAGVGTGDGIEGDMCRRATDCSGSLICIDTGFVDSSSSTVGICANGCVSDADCGTETCVSRTGLEADAHCENVEREEFAPCGVLPTAICAPGRSCVTFENPLWGLCMNICVVDADEDGGTASDPGDAGAGFSTCRESQTCLDVGFAPEQGGQPGICAEEVGRGDLCGLFELGLACPGDDICAPDDATDEDSEFRCREDCTEDGTCSEGACTNGPGGAYGYCLP